MRKVLALGAIGLGAAGLGAAAAFELRVHPMWRSWGIDPDEATRALPGDDLVAEPTVSDTRGISIDAPPEAVWPWLVQMGYGRAGWYSYDALDMRGKSVRSIVPEWQSIKVDDLIHSDPEGGFHVKVAERGRALVLYLDTADFEARNARRAARRHEHDLGTTGEGVPAGLAFSGGILAGATPDKFSASWAFVLEPLEGGRTRLIERYRLLLGETAGRTTVAMPALNLGMFIMIRRQMLGIRERAEELHRAGTIVEPTAEPTPTAEPVVKPEFTVEPRSAAKVAPTVDQLLEAEPGPTS